jgi:hypothetical protein
MALETQRLYDTSQGGEELTTALHAVVKRAKITNQHSDGREVPETTRLDKVYRQLARHTAAVAS